MTSDKLNYRVLLGSLSGSVIEWFDFLVYGTVAALVFNKLYFPSDNQFMSTLLAYISSLSLSSSAPWAASSSPISATG